MANDDTSGSSAPESGGGRTDFPGSALFTYSCLLGARLYLHTWVRLLAVVTIIIGTFVAQYIVGIEHLKTPVLIWLALVIAAYNAVAWLISRHYRSPQRSVEACRYLLRIMYCTIVLDYLSLTVAIWVVGGARSPFLSFYLLHVILSCLLLSRRAALVSTILAYALLALLVVGESTRIIPPQCPLGAVSGPCELDYRYCLTVLVVYGMLFGLTAFLMLQLSDMLRRSDRELREANLELGRLSSLRRDFLHIVLHDLKSPVGAIRGLLENVRSGLCGPLNEKQEEWIDRSLDRLGGLNEFLQELQILSALESGDILERAEEVDIAAVLRQLVDEHEELAAARRHTLRLDLPGKVRPVRGVRRLLAEAVANLITNAIKYTPSGGRIVVRAYNAGRRVRIEVEDNGVGIAPEDQERLFGEFVRLRRRLPTTEAKGTGLGLSIVRRIVKAHGGRASIESEVDAGSTFIIDLPAARAARGR